MDDLSAPCKTNPRENLTLIQHNAAKKSVDAHNANLRVDVHHTDAYLTGQGQNQGSYRSAKSSTKRFRCGLCCYKSDRKNNLRRHVIAMHERRPHVTECCGFLFDSKASLRDHVTRSHDNGYVCAVCMRNFRRKALLARHVAVHNGRKEFLCPQCGYASCNKSNLDRHIRRHAVGLDIIRQAYTNLSSITPSASGQNLLHMTSLKSEQLHQLSSASKLYPLTLPSETAATSLQLANGDATLPSRVVEDCRRLVDEETAKKQVVNTSKESAAATTTVASHRRRLLSLPYECRTCHSKFAHQLSMICHKCCSASDHYQYLELLTPLSVVYRRIITF